VGRLPRTDSIADALGAQNKKNVDCLVGGRFDGFALVFDVVGLDELLVDPVEFSLRQLAQQVPADVEGVLK